MSKRDRKRDTRARLKKTKINKQYMFFLIIIYYLVFMCSFLLIDYYANGILGPKIDLGLTFIFAIIAAYLHSKTKAKTQADILAKELEEII